MPNEPTIQVGEVATRVTDPHFMLPVSCDIIVEHRVVDGVLFVSLGSHIWDGSGPPEVRVVARLRLALPLAEAIYTMAQRAMETQRQAAEEAKKTAN
jgi:hypothetical protein